MTHIVIDAAVLQTALVAGDAVSHAAENRLCTCVWSAPYEGGQVKRELEAQCYRCRALAMWSTSRAAMVQAMEAAAERA